MIAELSLGIVSIAGALVICALAFSLLGFWRSGRAITSSIPDPEINCVLDEFTVIRMRPHDEHRFAISVIESRAGRFLVAADAKLRDLPDILKGYAPSGRMIRSAEFRPPAVSLIVRT